MNHDAASKLPRRMISSYGDEHDEVNGCLESGCHPVNPKEEKPMSAGDPKERARQAAHEFLEKNRWHCQMFSDDGFGFEYEPRDEAVEKLAALLERETEQLRSALAKYTENRLVGTCCDCGASIWFREAQITDETGTYHPICRVVKKLKAAERELAALKADGSKVQGKGKCVCTHWKSSHRYKARRRGSCKVLNCDCDDFRPPSDTSASDRQREAGQ
jgi:hypothetical protein